MLWKRRGEKPTREKSRAEYSAINAGVAMAAQMLTIVLGYVSRMVFTRALSQSYLGVNGLFADILGILALSELGIASAMSYALYRPVARNDIPKIQAVMKLYKWLYRGVAAFVGAAGLAMLPFLHWLAGDLSAVEHLELIYLLYLGNSVFSYLMMYKWSVIVAHQREYIVTLYTTAFSLGKTVAQIAILRTTGSYIGYLLAAVIGTVLNNLVLSRLADRMYPYLREKTDHKLPKEEKREIGRNIGALGLHRLGAVVINNTDSLLMSRFVGIAAVGIYSNYYLVISSIQQVLDRIFQGMAASVGNLGAMEDRQAMAEVFDTAFFIGQWMYGMATICIYELVSPFIELSFGPHYLLDRSIVLMLCVLLFLHGMRKAVATFWYAMGMFWFDRYKALAEAGLNLGLSIVLGLRWGMAGIFMGTILSMLLVPVWVDPYLFFRRCLKKPLAPFVRRYVWYVAVVALTWGLVDAVCALVAGELVKILVVRLAICVGMINGLFLLAHFRSREFKSAIWVVKSLLKREKNG